MSEFKILTLDEILAQTNAKSATPHPNTNSKTPTPHKSNSNLKQKNNSQKNNQNNQKQHIITDSSTNHQSDDIDLLTFSNTPKPKKQFAHAKNSKKNNKNPKTEPLILGDELAQFLKDTPQLSVYDDYDKSIRYLRWLAFYYLSKKELSAHQLRQKLLAKECKPDEVEKLLIEFAQKDYQSDERCATMIVRESLRKGRGKQHIKATLKNAKLPYDDDSIDRLLNENQEVMDNTILENDNNNDNGNDNSFDNQDWLWLAVEARTKKYGNAIPKDPKEKAKQLRFLQYRGFEMSICFDALKFDLASLKAYYDER